MTLADELKWRGLVKDTTLTDLNPLDQQPWVLYCGFDASAPSQTIGNLAALLAVKTFLRHGHRAILVAGGATTLIGDPGGKTAERNLQTLETIAANVEVLRQQISTVLGELDYEVVNNLDWLAGVQVLDWLREIGKQFSMSQLIKRDYIAQRLGADGSGISYAEFSYSLLQAYDFWHLFKTKGCRLQIGGADQWGNCVAGVELIQKLESARAEVITLPLVINQATGQKFGKSEAGAVWLDAQLTNPYDFYQFWLNCDDQGLEQYLKAFTELDQPAVNDLMQQQAQDPTRRPGQRALAQSVTELVHGADLTRTVAQLTQLLFDTPPPDLASSDFVGQLTKHQIISSWRLDDQLDLLGVLVDQLQLADSRTTAKQFIADGGLRVVSRNGAHRLEPAQQNTPARTYLEQAGQPFRDQQSQFWLISRGKNKAGLVWQ